MITLIELHELSDPLLLPWLDLYETGFPPGERVLVSHLLELLHPQTRGAHRGSHLLAAVDDSDPSGNPFLGLIFDYEPVGSAAAFLWYFAVVPDRRGQGLGAQIYQCLLSRLDAQVRALFYDLEDPAQMTTPEAVKQAGRRIAFYRRLGARLLGGIRYVQTVGPHHPPLYLRLMVHPIQEITPREAFDLARLEFGQEILSQVGELKWE